MDRKDKARRRVRTRVGVRRVRARVRSILS